MLIRLIANRSQRAQHDAVHAAARARAACTRRGNEAPAPGGAAGRDPPALRGRVHVRSRVLAGLYPHYCRGSTEQSAPGIIPIVLAASTVPYGGAAP
eukprot:COSAG02_NODE_153_length_33128_cov_10.471253_2_plen_97_part_00